MESNKFLFSVHSLRQPTRIIAIDQNQTKNQPTINHTDSWALRRWQPRRKTKKTRCDEITLCDNWLSVIQDAFSLMQWKARYFSDENEAMQKFNITIPRQDMRCEGNSDTNLQCSSLQAGPYNKVIAGTVAIWVTSPHGDAKHMLLYFLVDATTTQQDDAQSRVKLQKYTF